MSPSLSPGYGHESHGQRKEVRGRQNENECVCRRVQPHGGFVTLIICLDFFHVYRCQEGTKGPLCPASKESGYQKCDGVKRIEFLTVVLIRQHHSVTKTAVGLSVRERMML